MTNIADMNGVVSGLVLFFALIVASVSTFGHKIQPDDSLKDFTKGYMANFTSDPSIIPAGSLDIDGSK